MSNHNSANIGKIVAVAIVILLLLALFVGLVLHFSGITNKGGFGQDRLVVIVKGETVDGQAGGYYASDGDPLDIQINKSNYDVKIIANSSISFDVDISAGNILSYVAVGDDLTKGFDIAHTDDGFTVAPKGGLDVIWSKSFPNLTVDIDTAAIENVHDMFLLVITSDNSTVRIGFGYPITGVALDKTEIVL